MEKKRDTVHYCVMYFLSHRVHCLPISLYNFFHTKGWFDDEHRRRFDTHSREFYSSRERVSTAKNLAIVRISGRLVPPILLISNAIINYSTVRLISTLNISQIYIDLSTWSTLLFLLCVCEYHTKSKTIYANVSYNYILLLCTNCNC